MKRISILLIVLVCFSGCANLLNQFGLQASEGPKESILLFSVRVLDGIESSREVSLRELVVKAGEQQGELYRLSFNQPAASNPHAHIQHYVVLGLQAGRYQVVSALIESNLKGSVELLEIPLETEILLGSREVIYAGSLEIKLSNASFVPGGIEIYERSREDLDSFFAEYPFLDQYNQRIQIRLLSRRGESLLNFPLETEVISKQEISDFEVPAPPAVIEPGPFVEVPQRQVERVQVLPQPEDIKIPLKASAPQNTCTVRQVLEMKTIGLSVGQIEAACEAR